MGKESAKSVPDILQKLGTLPAHLTSQAALKRGEPGPLAVMKPGLALELLLAQSLEVYQICNTLLQCMLCGVGNA